ncbi:MAG: outer membrane lipoprotein carrier protein LolA [Rhodospirillales bacterium]|jgi:outer membrane lipoprotein-sorting protein|nr:outer membrane lipoprotein carrier protein LolA [Rhodospirillales bacterium]
MIRFLTFLLILVTTPVLSALSASDPYIMNAADKADVARVEAYLNSIGTMQARFVQVSSTGDMAEGEFFLSRPGDLRIDYDPPVPVLIVTSGLFLVYVDEELEQSTHIPISSTPVGVLVDDIIKLSGGDLQIIGVDRGSSTLRVGLAQTEDPYAGTITLAFSDAPLTLRQWTVRDSQGVVTDFALLNPRFDIDIDPEKFRYVQEPKPADARRDHKQTP